MPQLVQIPFFQPSDPYQHIVDNEPLEVIQQDFNILSDAIDNANIILTDAVGDAGSLSNRLNQSINPDGSLIASAINEALHLIDDHTDSSTYVRMLATERAKLTGIASDATDLSVNFNTSNVGDVLLSSGTVDFEPSPTITWRYLSGSIFADLNFSTAAIHTHYYGANPVLTTGSTYKSTSIATPYQADTLRVYINGFRLTQDSVTTISLYNGVAWVMTAMTFTEDSAVSGMVPTGLFTLSSILPSGNTVIVDFDVLVS